MKTKPGRLRRVVAGSTSGSFLVVSSILFVLGAARPAVGATTHGFIYEYEGPQTCLHCHGTAAAEVMRTTHWTWKHVSPTTGQVLGKNAVINNYCIAVPSNEPRCTSCHVGLGYADKTFDFGDETKVDCLVCHDTTGTYKKFPTGAGHPVTGAPREFPAGSGVMWPAPDLTSVARSVGKTSRATCGECHFYGGGGDAVKHGDMDSTLFRPTRDLDVHMGVDGRNFQCTACHRTTAHEIPGTRYAMNKTDNQTCESCHTTAPHGNARLNAHTSRVACQTCHIPEYARGGRATKMSWDWSTAGRKTPEGKNQIIKDANGDPIYDTQKGDFTWASNVVPEYRWFNGVVTYVTLDDTIDPTGTVTINRLHGDVSDPKARLFPVKRFVARQPYDAGRDALAIPHLFGTDTNAYWRTFDWARSLQAGMAYVDRPFSGEVGFVASEMYWIQNHMVAPKERALACADCHTPRGRLDFAALGYPAARASNLQTLAGFEIGDVQALVGTGGVMLRWSGTAGSKYRVQVSGDLSSWQDAVDGEREAGAESKDLDWSDAGTADSGRRFYRILRLAP